MAERDIEVLNEIIRLMIDSQKGYQRAHAASDAAFPMRDEFRQRAERRDGLIEKFQARVTALGGEPDTVGSALGAMHRTWVDFVSLFRDDQKAALGALDDGEDYLSDVLEGRLEMKDLTPETRALLEETLAAAEEGEAFADRLED